MRERREQAPERPQWQEQPARRSLSVGDPQLQYDFGGILGWRAEDRKVRRPDPLPELFSPTARTQRVQAVQGLPGSERLKVCRATSRASLLGTFSEAPVDGRSVPPHPAEPLRALAKGRRDRPCPCGSCGWQPVAAPSAGDWQRPRGRVGGLFAGLPASGRARGHGPGGRLGVCRKPGGAAAHESGREGRGAG